MTAPAVRPRQHVCGYCRGFFPSAKARAKHRCPERELANRGRELCWPIEPVAVFLTQRYGVFDQAENQDGYCGACVERLTGISRDSWRQAARRGLRDDQADQIATRLGARHEDLWPGWHDALEVTDDDLDWLSRWSKGA